ncbi:unnamed protein product, partial [Oikopleura dioica]
MCAAKSGETDDASTCLAKDQSKNAYAIETCQVLYSDLFKNCRERLDPSTYYEDCKESACSCSRGGECECLCATIASFARACAVAGEPVRWRSPDLCPLIRKRRLKTRKNNRARKRIRRSWTEKCFSCKRYVNLFDHYFKIKTRMPAKSTCRQQNLFGSEMIFSCKIRNQSIFILRTLVPSQENKIQIWKITIPRRPSPVQISIAKFNKIRIICAKKRRKSLNSRKEPIAEPIRVIANDILKDIPKSCKIAEREIVVFVESSDDDALLKKYTDAVAALKYIFFGDKNELTTKNIKFSLLKSLTKSQAAKATAHENEKIILWTDQLSLKLVEEIKSMFVVNSMKSKLLISLTSSRVNTDYWHYIFLEENIEIFSMQIADKTSLESRRVLISSPSQIVEGTHQIVQELCAAPKIPSKIDIEEILASEVIDMTPESIIINKCASEKSISIFYDSLSQEDLSDFVQKLQK